MDYESSLLFEEVSTIGRIPKSRKGSSHFITCFRSIYPDIMVTFASLSSEILPSDFPGDVLCMLYLHIQSFFFPP